MLNSISLAELQRKIGEIYFVDHYKMIADQFLYKKDFETSLFLRIAMETGIRSADIPCIEWSCMHGKTIILEETKRGDLYKKVNGTFPKISTQSLRIMKLFTGRKGKYSQNQTSTMFAKFLVLGECLGFVSIVFGIIGER